MAVASLFLLHFGSNTGYAIAPLEKLFFEAGLELAEGDDAPVVDGRVTGDDLLHILSQVLKVL